MTIWDRGYDLMQRRVRRSLTARGVHSRTRRLLGREIHFYELEGRGEIRTPLVLLHGLGGSANGFARVLPLLGEKFSHVFAPDQPGNGFSPLPPSGMQLTEYLDNLVAFLREVVKAPCLLVGNSLGGGFALRLAHDHAELLRALVLVAPAGAQVSPERMQWLLGSFSPKNGAEARALTKRLFDRAPLPAVLAAPLVTSVFKNPAVQAVLTQATETDLLPPAVLAEIKTPMLVLWGQGEKLLPYEGVEYFRQHLPKSARIEVVNGFGHVPQMERPKELVARVVEYAREEGL